MRVIAGKFKGKRLFAPETYDIRPTSDKIKESVFNILNSLDAIKSACVLDLFCGSGALGIEAISRGAKEAVFIDSDPQSVNLTKKNLSHCGAYNDKDVIIEVYPVNIEFGIKKLEGRQFNLIILDPPYNKGFEIKALELIEKHNILAKNGVIVCEHSVKFDLQNLVNGFIIDRRVFGNTSVSFLTRRQAKEEKENESVVSGQL